ncbi:unnamed protein product [Rotaria magnacalcarata]|uniref:K Homology domain-containing protein n=1 Tax=Rotaria magnacalcarata TaxID=392030 RepID=A0A816BPI4_9BILA|nr:unnamed protein product [Rotaria magnacalcarata]CAF1624451.1 unnamed protein product [Rotaria magnacalcarata]CAF2063691.1 unnamed protein product [Rotaria magnacalcarata]CAF2069031.1 unnamed protein product [Rotaria magnacalcarata]
MSEVKRLTPEELLEKRRLTLISRTRAARAQLDSLSLLDTSYDTCRQTLRQWRSQTLDQINRAHETSLSQLNDAYEQINRFRSNLLSRLNEHNTNDQLLSPSAQLTHVESSLNSLNHAEFTFDFDRARKLEGELQLLKLSHPQQQSRPFNKSNTKCRLLVPYDRYVSDVFFYDDLITRIDCQTPECILVCPFDLLGELLGNDEEVRILIDQTYLPSIGTQAQRMRNDYDLILLQPAQECCPQSSERVITIICKNPTKMLSCLEEIYTICSQQVKPIANNPYKPVNYNRSKADLYGGYSDILAQNHLQISNDINRANTLCPLPLNNSFLTPNVSISSSSSSSLTSSSSSSSQQLFDRVLIPVPLCQTLTIADIRASALLGPKGERIQPLQRETGAIVNIGSQQQVNNALQTIKKLLMIVSNNDDDDAGEDSFKRDGEKVKRT